MAFKKEMVEEARYQAAYEARDATWKKEAVELWGRAHRYAEEVYKDRYFARKVKGARHLIAAWRWADKLQHAIDVELRWAPNKMVRSFALIRQQEADRYVKRYEAEEEARYQAACEAHDAAWKKEAAELWGRVRRRAEEVYEDGYFARKVKGVERLVAAWRWADKL